MIIDGSVSQRSSGEDSTVQVLRGSAVAWRRSPAVVRAGAVATVPRPTRMQSLMSVLSRTKIVVPCWWYRIWSEADKFAAARY
jgi:hypothetical protein